MEQRKKELALNMSQAMQEVEEACRACGRNPEEVTVVAVSKLHPGSDIAALHEAGYRTFGENYVQEAVGKQEELAGLNLDWHFIGGLQKNKAKFVAGKFSLVHSVDNLKLAQTLGRKAAEQGKVQDILIQVNVACETQKCGVYVEELEELLREAQNAEGIRVLGFMTMPPFFDEPERARPVFAKLRELRDEMRRKVGMELPHLSMGMTGDFQVAIEEGATLVRIGTKIFGTRPPKV